MKKFDRYYMMKKIAKSKNPPKKIQVANARGRSLYHIYELVENDYSYCGKRWNNRLANTPTVTEAYSVI